MKKLLTIWLAVLGAALCVLAASGIAAAATFISGQDVNVTRPLKDDLYASGAAVTVGSEVTGTVIVAGQDVYIIGDVDGDVWAAGETVVIEGNVSGTVRAGANRVEVRGRIDGDLVVGASRLVVLPKGKIGRDAIIGVNSALIQGTVGRKMVAGASALRLDGPIGGDAKIHAETLTLGGRAAIRGDLVLTAPRRARLLSGSKVEGRNTFHKRVGKKRPGFTSTFVPWLWSLLSSLLTAVVLALVWPRLLASGSEALSAKPWMTVLTGVVFLIVVPVAAMAVLLMSGTLALPISVIVMGLYLLVVYLSSIMTAAVLGRWLLVTVAHSEGTTVLLSAVTGVAVLWVVFLILSFVPILAGLLGAVTCTVGTGAIAAGIHTFYSGAKQAELL